MTGTQKTVNINITSQDLTFLKDNAYRLCFAKKVNNTFDVVWQSYQEYLDNNSFLWTPVYQLFGSNQFDANVTVKVQTNTVNAGLGQQATLNEEGVLGDASTGGPSTAITLINDYGPIHPGLSQLSTGIGGQQESTPIYVATDQIALGQDVLTPIDEVMVWFEQNIETSTMFSDARSNSVTIDMTESNSQTRLYSGGKWSTPSASDLAMGVTPLILQIIVYATGAIIAQDLASKIASKLTGVYKDITVNVTTGASNQVAVTYSERQGLTLPEQSFLATLLTGTINDTLMEFTVQSLAQSGVEYTKLEHFPF
jgi:hypothetical protein